MEINSLISIATIILGIITIFLGIWIIVRCKGNLRWSVIFITLALLSLLIHNTGFFLNKTGNVILVDIPIVKDSISGSILFSEITDLLSVFFIF